MNAIPTWLQRGLVILMPPLSLVVCCAVMLPRHSKLRQVNDGIRQSQGQVQTYLAQLEEISKLPPDPMVATLPMTKQEQSDFLRGLAVLCNRTGNKIVSVESLAAPTAPPTPPGAAAPTQQAADGIPPDVVSIRSPIAFTGTFGSLRAFLRGLERSRRLISMTDMRIAESSQKYPDLRTTLTVTRYVDGPVRTSAPAQPAAGKT